MERWRASVARAEINPKSMHLPASSDVFSKTCQKHVKNMPKSKRSSDGVARGVSEEVSEEVSEGLKKYVKKKSIGKRPAFAVLGFLGRRIF